MDYLPELKLPIKQDESMFKMNTDTYHLGMFIQCSSDDIVLDIGTNNGALLLYASRFNPEKLIGIDIQEKAIALAQENMLLNGLVDVELETMDYRDFKQSVDVIVCNPPYFQGHHKSVDESIRMARHQEQFNLEELFHKASKLLNNKGRLMMIYPAQDLERLILLGNHYGFASKRMKFNYKESKKRAHTVCIEFMKGVHKGLVVEMYQTIK